MLSYILTHKPSFTCGVACALQIPVRCEAISEYVKLPGGRISLTHASSVVPLEATVNSAFLYDGTYMWLRRPDGQPTDVYLQAVQTLLDKLGVPSTGTLYANTLDTKLCTMVMAYMTATSGHSTALGFHMPDDRGILAYLDVPECTTSIQVSNIPGTPFYITDSYHTASEIMFTYQGRVYVILRYVPTVTAVSIVVTFYQLLHGCLPCSDDVSGKVLDYCRTSLTPDIVNYMPVTSMYIEVMAAITDDPTYVYVNPKYNGTAHWVYWDSQVGAVLVEWRKVGNQHEYKVVGLCSTCRMPRDMVEGRCCLLVEMVGSDMYVVDSHTPGISRYTARYQLASEAVRCLQTEMVSTYRMHITEGKRVTYGADCLPVLLGKKIDNTDGYIVYVDGRRPMKLKPASEYTVDIRFTPAVPRDMADNVLKGTWDYTDLPIKPIPLEMAPELDEESAVYEVSLQSCAIVRRRYDKVTGNPSGLIDSIRQKYKVDAPYASPVVWGGRDPTFMVVANRMIKRMVYNEEVPAGARIVDIGSGYGADVPVWKERGYRVVAVEYSEARYKELAAKTRSYSTVRCIHASMLDVDVHSELYSGYSIWTFMRSINAVPSKDRVRMLERLMSKRVKIVIVATTLDAARKVLGVKPEDKAAKSLCLSRKGSAQEVSATLVGRKLTLSNRTTTVDSVEPVRTYTDYLMSEDAWKAVAADKRYVCRITPAEYYLQRIYGTCDLPVMCLCKMDACIVYEPLS